MSVYCVYHVIHIHTPYRYIPKLFITDVPADQTVGWAMVDELASFGEFHIAHANHEIQQITSLSPPSIKRAYREGGCHQVTYSELTRLGQEEFDE